VPQTFNALLYLHTIAMCSHQLGYPKRLHPDSDKKYFQILLIKPSTWKHAWAALRDRWPKVYEPFLRYCHLSDLHRPPLLVPSEPFSQEGWIEQTSRAAHAAKLMIPIYEDTTLDEVTSLWKQYIPNLKEWVYREPEKAPEAGDDELIPDHQAKRAVRRQRPDQYEMRLKVWDAYQQYANFSDVAQFVGRPRSTVQGIYLQVSCDILGALTGITRTRKQRFLQGFDPRTHTEQCTVCRRASSIEEMCMPARTYAAQDEQSQRERPCDNIDMYGPAR
jgi:hypothetical protein